MVSAGRPGRLEPVLRPPGASMDGASASARPIKRTTGTDGSRTIRGCTRTAMGDHLIGCDWPPADESLERGLSISLAMESNTATSRAVLVIDADLARAEGLVDAFRRHGIPVRAQDPSNGVFGATQSPALILADIGHPTPDGLDVLKQIRSQPTGEQIPVIMLATDPTPTERARSFASRANGYVTHPGSENETEDFVTDLVAIWLSVSAAA